MTDEAEPDYDVWTNSELQEALAEMRRQRNSARNLAVTFEQEIAQLTHDLAEARADLTLTINRLALYESRQERIEMPLTAGTPIAGQEEIGGVGV